MSEWRGQAVRSVTSTQLPVCVPAHGFADVRLKTGGYSPIYGDPQNTATFHSYARSGGILVTEIALADEIGSC
jgi:hypothetical protein